MRYLVVVVAVALLWLNSCSEKQSANTSEKKVDEKNVTGADSEKSDAVKVIAKGTNYDIEKNLVKGKVTVFKFYADW